MLRENPGAQRRADQDPAAVVQGANDPRVNINESNQMVEALRARGVEVDYMVKDNEGQWIPQRGEPLRLLPRH